MKNRLLLSLFLLTLELFAATPELSLELTLEAPTIDADFSEAVWRSAPVKGQFTRLGTAEPAERQTEFRMVYGLDAFYLAIRAFEPAPEKLTARAEPGGPVWEDDSMELFFCSDDGRGVQLLVNCGGVKAERFFGDLTASTASPAPEWEAAARLLPDGYALELRIPYLLLPERTEPGDIDFNLVRNAIGTPVEHSSFAPLTGSLFFEPTAFFQLKPIHAPGAESIPGRLAEARQKLHLRIISIETPDEHRAKDIQAALFSEE